MSSTVQECFLGIDIGTSTIKTVLVDKSGSRVTEDISQALGEQGQADVHGGSERNVHHVLTVLESCLDQSDPTLLSRVKGIGVCGQMHGCVLWNSKRSPLSNGRLFDEHSSFGPLYTWQDARCTSEFLSSLPETEHRISSGYGCATLAWLQKFQPQKLDGHNRAGTIMDLVVWSLCNMGGMCGGGVSGGGGGVVMSAQNATSWGCFDATKMCWEFEILNESWFPVALLPTVVRAPAEAGTLTAAWHGIPVGTPVGVAMGDLQCSVLATQPLQTDAILNIGTASQLAVITPSHTPLPNLPSSVMTVPYFNHDSLVVAASLSGGNVIKTFVEMLSSWIDALGAPQIDKSNIYDTLISRAEEKMDTSLCVDVRLWGERHCAKKSGSVANLRADNVELGDVGSALCRGLVDNLKSMIPSEIFLQLKIDRIVGSGSSLLKNSVIQKHAESAFGLPLVVKEGVDAPLGAAIAMATLLAR